MGAKTKILALLLKNIGKDVSRARIITTAGGKVEWARRIRDLRQEGWQVEPVPGGYVLRSKTRLKAKAGRAISQKLRFKLFQAANGACPICGARVSEGAKLVIDHKIPLEWGGPTTEDNLWAICTTCNQGKRDHYSDQDAGKMRAVMAIDDAKTRILEYFKLSAGKKVNKDQLMLVARISEWARRVRELRAQGWDIASHNEMPGLKPGEYVLRTLKK